MKPTILYIIIIILLVNIVAAVSVIIFHRKKPEKIIAWVSIILVLPVIGLTAYIIFGRNWKSNNAYNSDFNLSKYISSGSSSSINKPEYESIVQLISSNSDSSLFSNNEVSIYQEGYEYFDALKNELLKAERHIHMEFYTLRNDSIGKEIKDILIKKATEGLQIRFIIDCGGSPKLNNDYIDELKNSGVDIIMYSCISKAIIKNIKTHVLYRDHRKLAIIDGKICFIGGNNIGDEYLGNSKFGKWRDTHLLIRGDFVHGAQALFLDTFAVMKHNNKEISSIDNNLSSYFPPSAAEGNVAIQLVKSGPDTKYNAIMQCILKMIGLAKDHIYITVPYFIPPQSIKEALKMAVLCGVDVRIIFPEQPDHIFMNSVSKSHLYDLVDYGIKIYLYDKNAFIHSKVVTVDGKLCTVGSTNLDHYSFEYNYEANAVIYDSSITEKLEAQFLEDLSNCTTMTKNYYDTIPTYMKLFQITARSLSGIL
jgi:cardiolipin synthase A/B